MARSLRSEETTGERHSTCSKCRRRVLKVKTPGEREIEVFVDTDIRWYVETDLTDGMFAGRPIHGHEEHLCWKEQ